MRLLEAHSLQQTLSIAAMFWGVCLVLVALEATLGENLVSSGLFALSIPMLVMGLVWANRAMLRTKARAVALFALGVSVLVYSSVIVLVGLVAASKLKSLLVPA